MSKIMLKFYLIARLFFLLLAIVVTTSSMNLLCYGAPKSSHKFVDLTVAGIVLGRDRKERVFRLLGHGVPIKDVENDTYLYFSPKDHAFVCVDFFDGTVDTITITDSAFAKYKTKGKLLNASIATSKGIWLGNSMQEVKKLYGEPEESKKQNSLLVLTYNIDYEHDPDVELDYDAYLTLKNNRLVEIHLHEGE